MSLVIEGLSKTYSNGVHALKDVSLTIPRGMFGLLGPNGAGKSTLMRILATLQEADSGRVTLDDIDVLRDHAAVRRTLGYLPQEFGLYPKVSAEELLDHFALLKGIDDRRQRKDTVQALLERTNLWTSRWRKLGTFSGGMRQRFGIAVALLGRPRLIVVDEPTAGLDPAERVRFLNLLSELGDQAVVILSTHIVEDVLELCTRMAIISQGEILAEGEPQQAVEALQGQVWRKTVERADLQAALDTHRVISTRLVAGKTVLRVHAAAAPEGFTPVEADLEDVYFIALRRYPAIGPDAAADEAAAPTFADGATPVVPAPVDGVQEVPSPATASQVPPSSDASDALAAHALAADAAPTPVGRYSTSAPSSPGVAVPVEALAPPEAVAAPEEVVAGEAAEAGADAGPGADAGDVRPYSPEAYGEWKTGGVLRGERRDSAPAAEGEPERSGREPKDPGEGRG